MKVEQLYWAAGFLDGEGWFGRNGGTISISAVQLDKWHIDKLLDLFGGGINTFTDKKKEGSKRVIVKSNNGVYHRWQVYGPRAAGVMMTLYSLLSPRRQKKIKESLSFWLKQGRSETHRREYFKCNHKKSETAFTNSKGYKECRMCKTEANRRYRERIRNSDKP